MEQTLYIQNDDLDLSLGEQLERVRSYVGSDQIKVVNTAKFGEILNPEIFFLDLIGRNHALTLVVFSLDQIGVRSTSLEKTMAFITTLNPKRIRFISLSDSIDTEATAKEFVPAVCLAVQTCKKRFKSKRVQHSLQLAKTLGEPVGRPKTRDDKKIRELRSGGLSTKEIAAHLQVSLRTVSRSLSSQAK